MAVFERVHHPLPDRDKEAGLPPVKNGLRERLGQRFRHIKLSRSTRRAQKRRDLVEQSEIDEWGPDLQGMRHAGPVRVPEELIAHVARAFQKRDLGA